MLSYFTHRGLVPLRGLRLNSQGRQLIFNSLGQLPLLGHVNRVGFVISSSRPDVVDNQSLKLASKSAETPKSQVLPMLCHGCGAYTQTNTPGVPGYYDVSRQAVQEYLGIGNPGEKSTPPHKALKQTALQAINYEALARLGIDASHFLAGPVRGSNSGLGLAEDSQISEDVPNSIDVPFCDRCHNLIHHNEGNPIHHPDVKSIVSTIFESPHKKNYVYHVIDAADFPMSLLPRTQSVEAIMPLRGRNRRAQHQHYISGKLIQVQFIITRADLLAPTKDQAIRLLPYLREVLRDALGRTGEEARLGDLSLVSAKHAWWSKELKETIKHQGGANWLVGKVNVGKSMLFNSIFPKGPKPKVINDELQNASMATLDSEVTQQQVSPFKLRLLPPAHPEQSYPAMPIVSALPGTTAQPIRRPFDGGHGELIDLPGLPRSNLADYVKPEHRTQLIMQKRISPAKMITVKPGQSLVLSGLISIVPNVNGPIMLMANFTPLNEHVTSNQKAIDILRGDVQNPMAASIAADTAGRCVQLASTVDLSTIITKQYSGPLTRRDAVGLKVDQLPFVIYGIDILIEGVGWVEVTAQVRHSKEQRIQSTQSMMSMLGFPSVEVYSPLGLFIGSRECMCAFLQNRPRSSTKKSRGYKK